MLNADLLQTDLLNILSNWVFASGQLWRVRAGRGDTRDGNGKLVRSSQATKPERSPNRGEKKCETLNLQDIHLNCEVFLMLRIVNKSNQNSIIGIIGIISQRDYCLSSFFQSERSSILGKMSS